MIPAHVPQVLVNREPLLSHNFDVELLGNSDTIIDELCHLLGDSFKPLCTTKEPAIQLTRDDLPASAACHNSAADTSETASPAFENPQLPQPEDVADIGSSDKRTTPEKNDDAVGRTEASEMSTKSETDICDTKDQQQQPPSVKISSQLKGTLKSFACLYYGRKYLGIFMQSRSISKSWHAFKMGTLCRVQLLQNWYVTLQCLYSVYRLLFCRLKTAS